MKLQLHEIVKISNNSLITREMLEVLNNSLGYKELELFREWLKIINREK